MFSQTSTLARSLVLGTIHVLGYVVAACAVVVGITYTVVAAAGGFVLVSGLGFVHRVAPLAWVNAVAFLLTSLTIAGIAFVVGDLAWRIRRGVTFAPSVSRSAWTLAAILGVGSWLARIAQTISDGAGLVYPDDVDPAVTNTATLPIGWPIVPQTFLPDAPLLGLAIVLAVLAYIVQSGESLQRDTDGLV